MAIYTKGTLPPEEGTFITAAQAHYKALKNSNVIIKTEIEQLIIQIKKNIEYAIQYGKMEINISFLRNVPVLENDDTMTKCIEHVEDYFIDLDYEVETSVKSDSIRMKIKW